MNTNKYDFLKQELKRFFKVSGIPYPVEIHMAKTHGTYFKIQINIIEPTHNKGYNWESKMPNKMFALDHLKNMEQKVLDIYLDQKAGVILQGVLKKHYAL